VIELTWKPGEFKGRDFINTQDWKREDLEKILECAADIKKKYKAGQTADYLKDKTLFMIFFNRSLRTRNSFEAGMTQLGGHAHFLSPQDIYTPALPGDEEAYSTERVADVARVLNEMGNAIAIRIYGKYAKYIYGRGNMVNMEFAKWAGIPLINMEDDVYHPCQGMADIMTIKEKIPKPQGKKFVMSWAYSPSTEKPMAVPQSASLITSMFGMDVVQAQPKGFDLDPKIIKACKENADRYGGSFEVSYDMKEAFEGADVVYPKCWWSLDLVPPKLNAKEPDWNGLKTLFDKNKSWICDQKLMDRAKKNAFYMHCLPADRGFEVTDEVMDGPNSVVFQQAGNRLHAQKGIMAMTM
jgi:ornithine carbamoyltransferase